MDRDLALLIKIYSKLSRSASLAGRFLIAVGLTFVIISSVSVLFFDASSAAPLSVFIYGLAGALLPAVVGIAPWLTKIYLKICGEPSGPGSQDSELSVADKFGRKTGQNAYSISFFIFVLGVMVCFGGDPTSGGVFLAVSAAVLSHRATTVFRIKRNYFGGNAREALEIISFIASEHKSGRPPGSKLFHTQQHARASQRNVGLWGEVAR